jgi:mono/diheme cytochrome c family protein
MKIRLRTIGMLFLLAAVSFVAGAALFVYFGIYNISAVKQHARPVYSLLEYAMRRSVAVRADEVAVPDLGSATRIRDGAVHYMAQCVQCHGAPGVAPHALAYGMTPMPVNLVSTARTWQPEEIYWVIRNGIKMSGMPAWESRLSEDEMWNVVAFVKKMASMTVPDYAALNREIAGAAAPGQAAALPAREVRAVPAMPTPTLAGKPAAGELSGNVEAGRRALGQYLCATCHQIPGVTGANNHVGPPLNGIATRRYIGGIIANNPENMVRWLMDPQQFDPLSAMPALGVSDKDARDIAAFLYTLDAVE